MLPQSKPRGQPLRGLHIGLGQIDTGALATVFNRQHACRPAQATPNIQHSHPRCEPGKTRQAPGSPLATTVELIQWGEVIDAQSVSIFPGCGEGIQNGLPQAAAAPVVTT